MNAHRWLLVIPILMIVIIFMFFKTFSTECHDRILSSSLEGAVLHTNILLDTFESDIGGELDRLLFNVEHLDKEYGINSLLIDVKTKELVSERVIGDIFCDPWTSPDYPDTWNLVLNSENPTGYFSLVCTGLKCEWYWRDITIENVVYRVMVGVQPMAVDNVIDYNQFYVPGGLVISLVIFCLCWGTFYKRKEK